MEKQVREAGTVGAEAVRSDDPGLVEVRHKGPKAWQTSSRGRDRSLPFLGLSFLVHGMRIKIPAS